MEKGAQSLQKGGPLRGLLGRGGGLRMVEGGLQEGLLAVQPGLAVLGLLPEVGAAGLEEGGLGIVPQLGVQDGLELALDLLVPDGAGDLHPPLEVPRHQVCRGDEVLHLVPLAKDIDPGVLQVPAHDAGDLDVLGLQQHPGADAADAPDDHLHLDPRLGGLLELVDDVPFGDGVGLDADVPVAALVDLRLDQIAQAGLQAFGGH